jgi:hypothetical protein
LNPRRPTVMPMEPRKGMAGAGSEAVSGSALPLAKRLPTRLDGVARQGLQLPLEQIRARFPALPVDAALLIQHLLQSTVSGTLTHRQAADWGVAVQQRYAGVVEQTLQLSQHPHRLAAQNHLQRLYTLLQEVFDALAQQLQPGLLARWRTSPWQILLKHQAEMNSLRQALAEAGSTLASQLDALQAMQKELAALTGQLQALALAASLLADLLPAGTGSEQASTVDLTEALLHRATELQQMHSHITSSISLRDHSLADLQALNACIQHAVLLLLPAWLDNALHASRASTNPTLMRQQQLDLDVLLRAIRPA